MHIILFKCLLLYINIYYYYLQDIHLPIEQSIFNIIMRSTDYLQASIQLNKLKIPNTQQWHIMNIILLCATKEPITNLYYSSLINQLCKLNPSKLYTFRNILKKYLKKYRNNVIDSPESKCIIILANLAAQVTLENSSVLRILAFFDPEKHTKMDILFLQTFMSKLFESINDKAIIENMLSEEILKNTKDKVLYFIHFFQLKYFIPLMKIKVKSVDIATSANYRTILQNVDLFLSVLENK